MDGHDENDYTEVESLCMNCMKNGITRLMLTVIPHFKEVIISSFECGECGFRNREVQSGATLAEQGIRLELVCRNQEDLDRQVIKSEYATITIPLLELEVPPLTQKGVCNTVEGLLSVAASDLEALQPRRYEADAATADKIQTVIERLRGLSAGKEFPFTVIVEDPSGNSHIEVYDVTLAQDPALTVTRTERTKEQLHAMGFYGEGETPAQAFPGDIGAPDAGSKTATKKLSAALSVSALPERILSLHGWDLKKSVEENVATMQTGGYGAADNAVFFRVECPHCGRQGTQDCCQIDVPGFRKCMILAFNCLECGSRSNEVKPMGAYGERARRWTLRVENSEDLSRDVLKSDTAGLRIPELQLELCPGTLGGVFTTVEGLISKIGEQLQETGQFFTGDAADTRKREAYAQLMSNLEGLTSDASKLPFTLVLDDAADMSMISSRGSQKGSVLECENEMHAPIEGKEMKDAQLLVEAYERSAEQNDDLGLTYMRTEGYEND